MSKAMSRRSKWLLLTVGAAAVLLLSFFSLSLDDLLLLMQFVCPIALPFGMMVAAVRLYQRWSGTTATRGVWALCLGLAANVIGVGLTMLAFLPAPPGGYGRPMGLALFFFLFALVMTPIGIFMAARARSEDAPLATSAMILSLAVFPIEWLTLVTLAAAKAFYLEP